MPIWYVYLVDAARNETLKFTRFKDFTVIKLNLLTVILISIEIRFSVYVVSRRGRNGCLKR